MYNNWFEIIEIMKSVLRDNRSRTEIKMALGSCLRTLGWRTSTGSMQNDYRVNSEKTLDLVLGAKDDTGAFHMALPIIINAEEVASNAFDVITNIMIDTNVKIAIVAGECLDLFFYDKDSNKAVLVGQVPFEINNEQGVELSSLLSARDFNTERLTEYFESLYKAKLPVIKLEGIINSIISDKNKAEEVLRTYLELEGFKGEIVDNVLKNVGIDIYVKDNKEPESNRESENVQVPNKVLTKVGQDNTRFSINGGPFLAKRKFVHRVVLEYIKEHPLITLDELEARFPSRIASKERGIVRTLSQVKAWATENGNDIMTRYCTKDNEILKLHDGTEIVVNNQWGSKNFPKFLALAKTLYNISSDAPYDEIEYSVNSVLQNAGSTRAKNFKFSMAGIKIGETIIFDATNVKVRVISDDMVEYNGQTYRLTTFVRTYLPDNMRVPSGVYKGPEYFSYNGETLSNLRNKYEKEYASQSTENTNDGSNNGIQISLQSYNLFKTKK